MVTGLTTGSSAIAATPHSEYHLETSQPLHPDFELQSDTEVIYVPGIGHIAQYHYWSDMLYSHGVIYYLRDTLFREVQAQVAANVPLAELRPSITRLNILNSNISAYENSWHLVASSVVAPRWQRPMMGG